MIRIGYIHEFDDSDEILMNCTVIESVCSEINSIVARENADKEFHEFMETKSESILTENVITDKIEKLGDLIKSGIDKIVELVEKVKTMVREKLWNRKSDIQKIEAICAKNPTMANKIKIAFDKGDLDVKDIKSLNDVMDGTYDILAKLDSGKIEPSKAEKKFNDLVEKYSKYGKPLIEASVATIGLILAIKTLGPKLTEARINGSINKNNLRRMKLSEQLDATSNPEIYTTHGRIVKNLQGLITKHFTGVTKIATKISSVVNKTTIAIGIKASDDDKRKELNARNNRAKMYNQILSRDDKTGHDTRLWNDEYTKQSAKMQADKDFKDTNP